MKWLTGGPGRLKGGWKTPLNDCSRVIATAMGGRIEGVELVPELIPDLIPDLIPELMIRLPSRMQDLR